MLRSNTVLSLVLLACTAPSYAGVEMPPFDPVAGFAPRAVNFDDQQGKGFSWNKNLPCGANRASVTVKFDKAYHSAKGINQPVAKIWLHAGQPGDVSEQFISAVVKGPTDAYGLNAQAWLEKATRTGNDGPGFAPADLDKPMRFDLAWTPDGVVTVSFNGEYQKHITADKPINSIGLGGSWSKFEFVDFQVGHSGPPALGCTGAPSASLQPDGTVAVSSTTPDPKLN